MEEVAGIAVADLGLSGLLSLAVLLILVGALIPRPIVKFMLRAKDDTIADQRSLIRELTSQNRDLIGGTMTGVRVAESIHDKAYNGAPVEAGGT